ncbi:UbiD family decarboxylase, partial [Vibrio vulnificus]|nr:UbiD family decarboxylase [Vibrio vulnificus]
MGMDATRKWPAELAMSDAEQECAHVAITDAEIDAFKLQQPRVREVYLPSAANNRFALIDINKTQAGETQAVMASVLAFLEPYADVKFVVLCDGDVNIRDWHDIIWAITTRMDPARDTVRIPA